MYLGSALLINTCISSDKLGIYPLKHKKKIAFKFTETQWRNRIVVAHHNRLMLLPTKSFQ